MDNNTVPESPLVITMNPVTFAKRLKEARLASGKTQQEIADHCGISNRTVSAWEHGVAENVLAENLFCVADFLGVNARWLAVGDHGADIDSIKTAQMLDALPKEKQDAVKQMIAALKR
jgi:transcriptional regulator with XRE-family HTH domain